MNGTVDTVGCDTPLFQAAALHYGHGEIDLVIVLPQPAITLERVREVLSSPSSLEHEFAKAEPRRVAISLSANRTGNQGRDDSASRGARARRHLWSRRRLQRDVRGCVRSLKNTSCAADPGRRGGHGCSGGNLRGACSWRSAASRISANDHACRPSLPFPAA